jgi:L-alanine-DL-glutamate epimerase-like enolase superfamily enzyme
VIERAGFRPYDLPLRRAWGSARGGFARRCGWLVWVEADGLTGYGDCAPLQAAGTESHEAAGAALERFIAGLRGQEVETRLSALDAESDTAATPAARFALDCALADLASRRRGLSLRRRLASEAVDRLAVNAMLGTLGAVRGEALADSQALGFRVLKLKVGVKTPASELESLAALVRHPSVDTDVRLRLDANGAWSFDQARRIIERLVELGCRSSRSRSRWPSRHPNGWPNCKPSPPSRWRWTNHCRHALPRSIPHSSVCDAWCSSRRRLAA